MADLFEAAGLTPHAPSPLADRLRPQRLDEVVGQDHLLGPDGPIRRMAEVKRLAIRTNSLSPLAGTLSGGNQQKIVLAKWLLIKPRVLILDEPTRGVDVGAKFEIYRIIRELAAQGTAILMVSSELPEVLGLLEYVETAALGSALATNADIRRLRDAASLSLHQFLAALVEAGGSERLARIHRRCTFELVLGLHQAGSSDVGIDSVPLEARTTLATALFERDDATARAVLAGLHGARRAAAGHPLATDSHHPEARR